MKLADIHLIIEQNRRTIGIAAAVVIVTEHPKPRRCEGCEGRIPNVVGDAETRSQYDDSPIRRPTQFVMSVSVAKLCKAPGHTGARRCVHLALLRIGVEVYAPQCRDQRNNRGDQPNWPPIRLHVECSPSSQ